MNRRRRFLAALAAAPALALPGCLGTFQVFNRCASAGDEGHRVDPELTARIWEGLDPALVMDAHVHLAGDGPGPDDPWVNPAMRSPANPFSFAHFALMANAACMPYEESLWNRQYVERLLTLLGEFPPGAKALLVALDGWRDASGRLDRRRTVFTVPDAYVEAVARAHPERFEWAASIHPYREDALERLRWAVAHRARAVKWIPYFMNIDPASPRIAPFYRALARSGLPLVTHGGWEHELVEGGDQELGNPLRIRAALQEGVRVIVAHCAMQGDFLDTDRGPGRTPRPSFELFARLMDSREYVDLLYGDLSAVTIGGRQPGALRRLLTSESWQPRLVNGSDYPGPGIVPVMSLKTLVDEGVLAADEVGRLAHIQHHNPMLFDFAVKRRIAWRGGRWPASAFETQRLFRAG